MPGDGIVASLEFLRREVDRLDSSKASKEYAESIKESLEDVKDSLNGLKRILITVALSWVAGTGSFLLAVLVLAGK
jgi:hypothetical protein